MRLKIVFVFIIAVMMVLLARVYFISIKSNTYFEELSRQNYEKTIYEAPVRGIIKDRNGVALAINNLGFTISIKPHLRSKKKLARLEKLVKLIVKHFPEFKEEDLIKKYKKEDSAYKHTFVKVVDYIEYDKFFSKYSIFNSLEDIKIEATTKRHYPYKEIAAHVIGYTGKASVADITKNSTSKYTGIIGKSGLEKYHNNRLQGKLGKRVVKVNALNQEIEILDTEMPSDNNDIVTTIDIKLQKYIHELFTEETNADFSKRSGAVIVMDSNNGEILAAGSFPEFNNNIFVSGISAKEWDKIKNDFNHPFTNKLVNGLYPPGSVLKMGVALSYLENGIKRDFNVFCKSNLQLGKRKFRCWKEKGHAATGFTKAIRESCDDFFYKGSLKIGINKISKTLDKFGFGKKTGVDQINEFVGVNPNKSWKRQKYNIPWYIGETVVSSIGQGFVLVTPMQIARYTASLTNGKLPTPHFLKDEKYEPSDLKISKSDLKFIQKGMYQVCNHHNGTAVNFINSKVTIAGKTGTAQVVGIPQSEKKRMKEHELEYYQRSHAWLTTYGPYKDPRYVVTVLVEHGGHGGSAAGAIVSKIYNKLYELGYIKK